MPFFYTGRIRQFNTVRPRTGFVNIDAKEAFEDLSTRQRLTLIRTRFSKTPRLITRLVVTRNLLPHGPLQVLKESSRQ